MSSRYRFNYLSGQSVEEMISSLNEMSNRYESVDIHGFTYDSDKGTYCIIVKLTKANEITED